MIYFYYSNFTMHFQISKIDNTIFIRFQFNIIFHVIFYTSFVVIPLLTIVSIFI